MKSNMTVGDWVASTTCLGCDKDGKECVVLATEAFTGPHCAKCLFREVKKRTHRAEEKTNLFASQAG